MILLQTIFYCLSGLLAYWLLRRAIPKGTLLAEFLEIPRWLIRCLRLPIGKYREHRIRYGKHFRQYLLFFQPENGVPVKPHLVVYFHGGGWQFSRPEMWRPAAQALVNEGYCVVMPSHRRLPFFDILSQKEDAALAVRKTLEIMQLHGISDRKIILGGMSSGGNLAALVTFDRSLKSNFGLTDERFAGYFFFGAPLDLYLMRPSPPLFLLGGRRKGELFPSACPACYLQPGFQTPVLQVNGTHDGLVEYKSALSFRQQMEACEPADFQFHTIEGGVHTDAASWIFPHHPSRKVFFDWLQKLERRENGTGKSFANP